MALLDQIKNTLVAGGKQIANDVNHGLYDVNATVDPAWAKQKPYQDLFPQQVTSPLPQGNTAPLKTAIKQRIQDPGPLHITDGTEPSFLDTAKHTVSQILGTNTGPKAQAQADEVPSSLDYSLNDPGQQYNQIIDGEAKKHGVPAPLLKGVLAHESEQFAGQYVKGYHTDGTGRGIAGIDKVAHPEVTDQQAFDPNYAIGWSAQYLANLHKQEGSWTNALKRYNGGNNYNSNSPGYAGVPISQRTADYAKNVLNQANYFAGYGKPTDNTTYHFDN